MSELARAFIPGLELSRRFYREAVWPLVREHFGDITHTAARIGGGSEVLGFDTARSADHEWGPRLQFFLHRDDAAMAPDISAVLSTELPREFLGYSTNFVPADDGHIRTMAFTDGLVFHRVDVTTLDSWFADHLGFDPRDTVSTLDWLALPTQVLAEVTGGAVFHDGPGELTSARSRLAWYPDDIWRYVLACQWQRIGQEEAFVGRCGEVGDDLGSAVVTARLARDLMRLNLLTHRRYPPYGKWLGSAFARIPSAATIGPALRATIGAITWQERENHLATAYTAAATSHNELGLTDPLDTSIRNYHERPFRVLRAERFADALIDSISDPEIRALPRTGSVDQFVDCTDLLTAAPKARAVTTRLVG